MRYHEISSRICNHTQHWEIIITEGNINNLLWPNSPRPLQTIEQIYLLRLEIRTKMAAEVFNCPSKADFCLLWRTGSTKMGYSIWGFPQSWGVPQKRWMVFVRENPIQKWMIWGYPILGNLHIYYSMKLKKHRVKSKVGFSWKWWGTERLFLSHCSKLHANCFSQPTQGFAPADPQAWRWRVVNADLLGLAAAFLSGKMSSLPAAQKAVFHKTGACTTKCTSHFCSSSLAPQHQTFARIFQVKKIPEQERVE